MCKLDFFDYECDSIVDVSDSVLCKLSAFLDYQKDLFAKGKYWGQADLQNENLIFSCFRLSDVFGLKTVHFKEKLLQKTFKQEEVTKKFANGRYRVVSAICKIESHLYVLMLQNLHWLLRIGTY